MSQIRPAGFSSDEDSDDYGFFEKPARNYNCYQHNNEQNIEGDLESAIINDDKNVVEKILINDLNQNLDYRLKSGWTPLMHACYHAKENIVEYLINRGADPNLHSESVMPVMIACSNSAGSKEAVCNIVRKLIEKKCFLNVGDKFGQTPLMRAIGSGRSSVVSLLLENNVNIESRDHQGWTAVFWAVHHNQLELLKILINHGARLTEVDRNSRKPYDIAISHGHQEIITFLEEHLNINAVNIEGTDEIVTHWFEFYPGINNQERLSYISEIPHLLYGMNCEQLTRTICNGKMDLRSFLIMDEKDMIKMGIDMPYERQRLKHGLRNFHKKNWNVNCISGLYARTNENYGVINCLTSLGSHLQQIYIIEATLQYSMNQYSKIHNQIKFEPPDTKLLNESQKLLTNIKNIKKEMNILKGLLFEIRKENPKPIHLIKEKLSFEVIRSYIPSLLIVCTMAVVSFSTRNFIKVFYK